MDPREFYALALNLVADGHPAAIRTAVSRAYYAAFHVGADLLRDMGFPVPRNHTGHQYVNFRLSNCGQNEAVKIASKLGNLQSKRIEADYRLHRTEIHDQKTAEALLSETNDIIQKLVVFCKGSDRDRIIESIKKWERDTNVTPR